MTDRELMQQALEALTAYDGTNGASQRKRVLTALRDRLAQPEPSTGNVLMDAYHAMQTKKQPQMQPCAGRNCGSTNPNLHSAECFEDYEKSAGMAYPAQRIAELEALLERQTARIVDLQTNIENFDGEDR